MSNGYQDNLTIDRIDNNGDYCPVNCQWIPKSMNSRKKSNMRQVNQYSLNGEFIATYQSIREAERQTSTPHGVGAVCVGKAKRAGNYKWEYKDGI